MIVGTPVSSMAWVMCGSVIGSLGAVGLKAGANRLKFDVKSLLTNWPLIWTWASCRSGPGVASWSAWA